MKIQPLNHDFVQQIIKIHEKHFKDEFTLEDIFSDKLLNRFVIVDDSDKVVTYGGIRLLFELVSVTDLDRTQRERVIALKTLLNKAISEGRKKEFEQIHCFATYKGENWVDMLEKVGFSQTKGRALYMNL